MVKPYIMLGKKIRGFLRARGKSRRLPKIITICKPKQRTAYYTIIVRTLVVKEFFV
jgi:hypothetical protein